MNQVFEAHVYASVAANYGASGWALTFIHPPNSGNQSGSPLRLKFSTRGRPGNYSFVQCCRATEVVEVRHQLRVATWYHKPGQDPGANVVLDVAVIRPVDLRPFGTNDAVPNAFLVTFGEAKHMSAFAELIASFLGLVHEMQPHRLGRRRANPGHPPPFLYVSGFPMRTASGLIASVKRRGYDVSFYYQGKGMVTRMPLPTIPVHRSTPLRATAGRGTARVP
jgi:hypothetical protein